MEESKLRTHRRPSVGTGQPSRRSPAAAPASSHVIDLRAAKNEASSVPTTPVASKSRRRAPAKAPRRPLAAPNQSVAPVAQAAPAAVSRPNAAPLGPALDAAPVAAPTLPPRRFWPAFWRFLLLLLILALVVVGGVYLYINYYRG